ncbi:MAG: hydroxymethylglutaryl-CoA lyase [Pseudomonadota bacterium]
MNETGLRRALRTEAADIRGTLYVTASAEFLRRNTGWSPSVELDRARKMTSAFRQAGVAVSELTVMAAFGCNYSADVDVSTVINCIDRLQNASVESEHASDKTICLADTMAWATPKSIRHVVSSVRERWPESRIALHLHDTRGLAMANALAALELGVDCFDSAVAGLGGCPFASHQGAAGNICTEDFALLCEEMGIETGIDLDRLCEVAQFAESIVGHTLPGRVKQGMSLGSYRGGQ